MGKSKAKPTAPKEGWGYLVNSKKMHYFVENRSLCMRWAFFGSMSLKQFRTNTPDADDCTECFKRRQKMLGKPVVEEKLWDVRLEWLEPGFSIDIKTGKTRDTKPKEYTRVKYRKLNSKGRWNSFVVQGDVPKDHQELVNAYLRKQEEERRKSA